MVQIYQSEYLCRWQMQLAVDSPIARRVEGFFMQMIFPASAISKWLTRCRGASGHRPLRQHHQLPRRQILTVRVTSCGAIQCNEGGLWLTRDGRAEDVVLGTGQTLTIPSGGRVLIEALENSSFEITGA